jgi:hypothetical protein
MKPVALLLVWLVAAPLSAAPILPADRSPALDAAIVRHERQFYGLNALPFGLSLDTWPANAEGVALIDQFLADDAPDFATATGKHPFEVLGGYGEHGDLGFFGGVAVVGTAFRYVALKREGAPADVLAEARARVERAARSWHVFKVVTGGNGLVARGIQRLVPENPDDPPVPLDPGVEIPLADAEGNPLPQPKDNGSWRADNSGGALPAGTWNWIDSCSKDQLVGQVLGMVALYEALRDDPDADPALVAQLADDASAIGRMLMKKHEITGLEGIFGSGEYDLMIWDADGRPTFYQDLNPLALEKVYFKPESGKYNVFNLFMAIGILKALHHVSGDPDLEAFLYDECLGRRGWLDKAAHPVRPGLAMDYVYSGTQTNFDVPDMTGVALFLALYLETDPQVSAVLRAFLEDRWWNRAGETHTARLCKQPLWHALYLASTDRGTDQGLVDELVSLLTGFDLGPYWSPLRQNCDEAELAARHCVAIDGTTVLELEEAKMGAELWSKEALDPRIRPPSDFDARSNPFNVNGGGGTLLNPGGDLLAAYWLVRALDATAAGQVNRSPFAREHMPVGGTVEPGPEPVEPTPDALDAPAPDAAEATTADVPATDVPVADPGVETSKGGGSGCTLGGPSAGSLLVPLVLLATLALVRVRSLRRAWLLVAGCLLLACGCTGSGGTDAADIAPDAAVDTPTPDTVPDLGDADAPSDAARPDADDVTEPDALADAAEPDTVADLPPADDLGPDDGGGEVVTAPDPVWGYAGTLHLTQYMGYGGGAVPQSSALEILLQDAPNGRNHVVEAEAGACRLYRAVEIAPCTPACADDGSEYCSLEGQCVPFPQRVSAGTITVSGVAGGPYVIPVGEQSWYAAPETPPTLFTPGAAITVSASGGDVPAFEAHLTGVGLLQAPIDGALTLLDGADQNVTWSPADDGSTVELVLQIGWHGRPPDAILWCSAPDAAGRVTVPKALIEAFPYFGGMGLFQHPAYLRRVSRAVVDAPGGPVEVWAASVIAFGVIH